MKFLNRLVIAAGIVMLGSSAWAGDTAPRHDENIEKAAAERAARKIGDLRGSFGSDASLSALIEMDARRRHPDAGAPREKPDSDALPPMVMNTYLGVDPIVTGSNGR